MPMSPCILDIQAGDVLLCHRSDIWACLQLQELRLVTQRVDDLAVPGGTTSPNPKASGHWT